jgi:hypothetical protein
MHEMVKFNFRNTSTNIKTKSHFIHMFDIHKVIRNNKHFTCFNEKIYTKKNGVFGFLNQSKQNVQCNQCWLSIYFQPYPIDKVF